MIGQMSLLELLPGERLTAPPRRALCVNCLRPVLVVHVGGELRSIDYMPWEPEGSCETCQRTRHAWPGHPVSCVRCDGRTVVGSPRPPGRLVGIECAGEDEIRVRVIDPDQERRPGEAAHEPHVCRGD